MELEVPVQAGLFLAAIVTAVGISIVIATLVQIAQGWLHSERRRGRHRRRLADFRPRRR